MQGLRPLLAASALGGALAACSPSEPSHDIAYYRGHPDVRATKLAACRSDRGKRAATSNCINALAADSEAVSERFWTVPPTPSRVANPGKL
jgi:hypothetical protein